MAGIDDYYRGSETPKPVVVTTESGPGSAGTHPGIVLNREKEVKVEEKRGFFRRMLAPMAGIVVGAAALVGPDAVKATEYRDAPAFNAAKSRMKTEGAPKLLERAQRSAARKLYGVKDGDVNVEPAKELADSNWKGGAVNVNAYVNPKHTEISPDGLNFKVDGKWISLSEVENEDGVFHIAGQELEQERLFRESIFHVVNPVAVGGIMRNDPNCDLNGDGINTPEEVKEKARERTRNNLGKVLAPPEAIAYK